MRRMTWRVSSGEQYMPVPYGELRHDGVGAAGQVVDVAQEHVPALDVAVHLRDRSSAMASHCLPRVLHIIISEVSSWDNVSGFGGQDHSSAGGSDKQSDKT